MNDQELVSRFLAILVSRAGGAIAIPRSELDAAMSEDGELVISSDPRTQILTLTTRETPQDDPRERMRQILRTSTASLKKLRGCAERLKDARETFDASERLATLTGDEKQKLDDGVNACMGAITGGRS